MSNQLDIFGGTDPVVRLAQAHPDTFLPTFLEYLPNNLHVYRAFKREALRVVHKGFQHYSARTIIEVLRHESALSEDGGEWKLNNNFTPQHARLFALDVPAHADLFEFRSAPGTGTLR